MRKIIFSKYSNERAGRFSMRTDICKEENGTKAVYKMALYPEGKAHIAHIYDWYEKLSDIYQGTDITINRCEKSEDGVKLEYLTGNTLEHVLDGYLSEGRIQQTVDVLMDYLQEVKKGFTQETFQMTPEFQRVFGQVELPEDALCAPVANIDMVLNNVIVNHGWTLIDYEWTFDFPVPYDFVAYRILFYYLNGSSSRSPLWEYNLMEKAGISEEAQEIFQKMETHFQEVYLLSAGGEGDRHMPLRMLYEKITPGTIDLKTSVDFNEENGRQSRKIQLYQSNGNGFQEEESELQDCHADGTCLNSFKIKEDTIQLRLDPCSRYCIIRKLQMVWGSRITRYQMNGLKLADGSLFFPVDDPQILIEKPEQAEDVFRVYFEAEYLTMEEAFYLLRSEQNKERQQMLHLQNQIRQKEEQISQMENTKVWKAYRKIKKQ